MLSADFNLVLKVLKELQPLTPPGRLFHFVDLIFNIYGTILYEGIIFRRI